MLNSGALAVLVTYSQAQKPSVQPETIPIA